MFARLKENKMIDIKEIIEKINENSDYLDRISEECFLQAQISKDYKIIFNILKREIPFIFMGLSGR